ncbi:MAG: DUF2007 domain-containing protein [Marinobacter sp.]|uniref:DUF2007 domain-containing protein n=1 Tax=Marinobacter sp. TaxID=50741 RepID=UPI0034A07EF1
MSWVTLGRYSMPLEAHLDRSRLESEGIDAFVADEHTVNMQWMLSNAIGGVRLQVQEDDLYRARRILAEDRSGLIDDFPENGPAHEQGAHHSGLSDLASKRRKRGFFAMLLALFIGS